VIKQVSELYVVLVVLDYPLLNKDRGPHVRFYSSFLAHELVAESSVGFYLHLFANIEYPILRRGVFSIPFSFLDPIVEIYVWLIRLR